jgi:hypothetical protein
MIWVLIGEGVNRIEIPSLVWSDGNIALAECKKIFGEEFEEIENEGLSVYYWDSHTKYRNGFPKEITEKMYTGYYGGCGECTLAFLCPVIEGKPFVHWDLD